MVEQTPLIVKTLNQSKVFRGLSVRALEVFCGIASLANVADKAVIIAEGETQSRDFYILVKGAVDVQVSKPTGPVTIATLKRPSLFGEMSFATQQPRSASVVANGAVELLCFPSDRILEILDSHPMIATVVYKNFIAILSAKLSEANDKVRGDDPLLLLDSLLEELDA